MRAWRILVATAYFAAVCGLVPTARAQPDDPLAAARQLFAEALQDEEQQRFAMALEKYKRVQNAKDTAAVRFRIAAAYEGLGKVGRAVDAYAGAVKLAQANGTDADIAKAAQARIDALSPRIGHLSLRLTAPPANAEVMLDSEPLALDHLTDIPVDAGPHVVTANAKGMKPFRAQVSVAEGGRTDLPITLEADAPPPPPPPPPPPSGLSGMQIGGIAAGVAGVGLVVGGAIVLAIRAGHISDLERDCPNNACPKAREAELQDVHDTAVSQGPLGAALLIGGGVALGAGVTLFLIGGNDSKTTASIRPAGTGTTFTLTRTF